MIITEKLRGKEEAVRFPRKKEDSDSLSPWIWRESGFLCKAWWASVKPGFWPSLKDLQCNSEWMGHPLLCVYYSVKISRKAR